MMGMIQNLIMWLILAIVVACVLYGIWWLFARYFVPSLPVPIQKPALAVGALIGILILIALLFHFLPLAPFQLR
jgi:hypothetical protein